MTYYKNIDTNEIWELGEIKAIYDSEYDLQKEYDSFSAYLNHLLALGQQKVGGIVETKKYSVTLVGGDDDGEEVFETDDLADAINYGYAHADDAPLGCSIFDRVADEEVIDW